VWEIRAVRVCESLGFCEINLISFKEDVNAMLCTHITLYQ